MSLPLTNSDDWRDAVGTVHERMKYLLESGHKSDVQFLVGNEETEIELIKAHKFVLDVIGSEIFEAQFRTNEANNLHSNEPIKVIDLKPGAFKAMLKFLYLNDLSGIIKENVADVLSTAKKYLLHAFAEKCIALAMEMLDCENVLGLLKVATLHEENVFLIDNKIYLIFLLRYWLTIAGPFIDENISDIVETNEFLLLSQEEITKLFDTLQCDQLVLFQGLNSWAHKQCRNNNIEHPTGEQKRAAMGPALNSIDFLQMSPTKFINRIVLTGILNEKEMLAIVLHNSKKTSAEVKAQIPLPFAAQRHTLIQNWNKHDCGSKLAISENEFILNHTGPDHCNNSVRAILPFKFNQDAKMPYIANYFEVKILRKNPSRWIDIGFCDQKFPLELEGNGLGNEKNSIGICRKQGIWVEGSSIEFENPKYDGDDDFKVDDIVGIGLIHSEVDKQSLKCFATYKGKLLGFAILPTKFTELVLYPAATLWYKDDSIETNFGEDKWQYDPNQLLR